MDAARQISARTLPFVRPPLRGVGRAARAHSWALLALALFLGAGLAVLDDYGIEWDEPWQREFAEVNLDYALGGTDVLFGGHGDFYGIALEIPLFLIERFFGLDDIRSAYLSRHLITHLIFLAGGLFAYLLARRLFDNGSVALFALLFFLMHPRLYALSFFNTKDLSVFVMFVIALFLTHRAFKRGRISSFVLLGAAVGTLINLLITGCLLFAAIPAMRTLDFIFASGHTERKRIILSTGAFGLTSLLVVYALMPSLWMDPVKGFAQWWTTFADYPNIVPSLFRGMDYRSIDVPWDYIPTWFSITTPPFALLLGLTGSAAVILGGASADGRRKALRNTRRRFVLLLVGCFALPILAVLLLDPHLYSGWRKFYFLWAPFSLLAALGLWRLLSVCRPRRLRASIYGAAGAGVAATLIAAALIHPNQQASFNFFVDRAMPERLKAQFEMDPLDHSARQALEWLIRESPTPLEDVNLLTSYGAHLLNFNAAFLPGGTGERLLRAAASMDLPKSGWANDDPSLHRVKVYGNTILTTWRKSDVRAAYESALRREPAIDSIFDVYRLDDALVLIKDPCARSYLTKTRFGIRVTPADPEDLPSFKKGRGSVGVYSSIAGVAYPPRRVPSVSSAVFDGKCAAVFPLAYPITDFEFSWEPEFIDDKEARETIRKAQEDGRLLARAEYDVHLSGSAIVYVNESCDPAATERRFFLHAIPQRVGDLPEDRRAIGFDNLSFDFYENGALLKGTCVASVPLPEYPVAAIRTGQIAENEERVWSAEFPLNAGLYRAAYEFASSRAPAARAEFDLHLLDGGLTYVKEPCGAADTATRFFLHVIPERAGDLPDARREAGFDNLDFDFWANGAVFDGKCAARVPLPEYEVARIRTGQFTRGGEEIWRAEFEPLLTPSAP